MYKAFKNQIYLMDYACPHDKVMGTCLLDINIKINYEVN